MADLREYDDEIDLVDYIQVLIKRKWFIFITTGCFALVGILFLWFNKTYEAQTLVLLSLKVEQKSDTTDQAIGTPGSQLVIPTLSASTYEVLATTSDLSRSLRDSLKAAQTDTSVALPPYKLNAELMQQSGNSPSQLMTLNVSSPSPDIPVDVVNTWTRLFVERNRGLSSGVAQSYHDWVAKQYKTAEENLMETEKALRDLDAKYHNLSILQNEVTIKNTELDASLKSYQSLEVSLESKLREKNYFQNLLESLEINGEWIGVYSVDQLPSHNQIATEPVSMRKNLVILMHELSDLERDSIAVAQTNQDHKKDYEIYAETRILEFSRDRQINVVRKRLENLIATLDTFRTTLPDLENNIKNIDIEMVVYNQNLEREKPVFVLSKAITDDALWDQVATKGQVSEQKQENLSRYKLQTEEANPSYRKLVAQITDLRIKKDLYQQRIVFLKREIPDLQKERLTLQSLLDTLEVDEQALTQDLQGKLFSLNKKLEITETPIFNKLQRRRLAFADHRTFYFERKQQLETLEREIQRIQIDADFQRNRFTNWSDEIQSIAVIADSLQITRTQLQRNLEVYKETFQRFSRLIEEARISLEQAAGDLQVISWASDADAQSNRKYFLIIVLAGGMVAVFLAFILEYIQKAQTRLKDSN